MGNSALDYLDSLLGKKNENENKSEKPPASAGGSSALEYLDGLINRQPQQTTPATPFMPVKVGEFYEKEVVPTVTALERVAADKARAEKYSDTATRIDNAIAPPKAPMGVDNRLTPEFRATPYRIAPNTQHPGMRAVDNALAPSTPVTVKELATAKSEKARRALGYKDENGDYIAGSGDEREINAISKSTGISAEELKNYAKANDTGAQRQAYTELVNNGGMSLDEFKNVSRKYNINDADAEGLYAYYGIDGLRKEIRDKADSPYTTQSQYEIARYVEKQLKDRGYTAYGYESGKYIMPAEYAEVILRETSAPEGGYTAENLADYPARALALCAVDVTKNPEWEKEADQIYDILYNNLFSKNDEWRTGGDIWTTVANNIRETARPTAVGIMLGLAKGLGSESIAKLISEDVNEKFDTSYARVSQLAPTATNISNTVGTIGLYTALAYLTGGVASSVAGAGASVVGASAASTGVKLATAGLMGAMTFGSVTALQNLGDYARGNINIAEYGKRIGQSEVVGAATSLASGLVRIKFDKALTGRLQKAIYSNAGENFTTKIPQNAYEIMFGGDRMPLVGSVKNPQTIFYYFTRNMASGLAGSGAFIASNALVTGEAPTPEQIAYQFAFGFVSSLVHSFIEAHSVSAAQAQYAQSMKERIGRIDSEMQKFYQYVENEAAGRPVSADGAVSAGGDLGMPNASDLIVEIENLRRYLVASLDASSPNAVSELAVVDYYLAGLQETLAKYVVNPTTGAPMGDYAAMSNELGAAPIGIEAAGNYAATEELSGAITSALDAGITEGAMSPADVVRAETEATPLIAPVGETLAPTPEPSPAEQTLTQLAEEAVAPTEPQVAPTAPEAVVAPIEAEQTTRIAPETENAGNAQITPPARNEQEAAARTESAKSWEIIGRDFGENGQKAFADVFDPELTKGELGTLAETFTAFYNAGKNNTGLDSISRELMQAALEVYGNDTDAAFEMERAAVLAGRADAEMKSSLVEDRAADDGVIDLSDDTELAKRIAGKSGSEKYNAIRDYILEELSGIDVVLSDGNNAIVDRKDAQHIAHKAGDKKRRAISEIKRLVEHAKLVATEKSVDNNKFRDFRYYEASVRYHDKTFPVYINVGIAKNDGSYHIYDITHKLRATAHRLNGVGRVTQTYALEAVPLTPDSIPDNTEKVNTVSEKSDNPAKKSDNPANTAMTMAEARRMIETAYRVGEIKEWYADEGTNQTVDEWLKNVGSDDIAMIIENDFDLQRKYINSNTAILDDEYQIEDVIDAYKAGTLVGKEKKKAQRLDVKKETGLKDDRFYAPREIENAKERFELAQQRITNANKQQVIQARADIVIFAHNRNAAELLGISQAELNKKLRSWTRYSASAREISERINAGVPLENRWTGIENSSFVNQASISQKDIDMLVKSVTGDPNGAERKYIARVMLALDTHIDYKGLNFIFESKAELNKKHGFSGRTNGVYNGYDTIACKYMAPNTVAHEMGHYLDTRFARDLVGGREDSRHYLTRGVNKDIVRERYGEDGVRFVDNFNVFMDGLTDVNDAYSSYSNDRAEVFARFVARFVEWTENVAAGYRMSNYEYNSYNDRFTTAQYVEFARLLQEKSLLDGMRANGAVTTAEGANTSEIKQSISKIVDVDGKDYGIGVYLDSILLEGLTDAERSDMVKEYVKTELAGSHLLAYNSNGAPVDVAIAEYGERFTDENGKKKKVLKELYGKNNKFKAKQESVVLADELLLTAKQGESEKSRKAHDWLDNNGQNDWDYWTTYIQDKNKTVWLATLNIANATDGRKILYDINPIKMVAEGLSWPSTTTNKYTTTPSAKSQEEIEKFSLGKISEDLSAEVADLMRQLKEKNEQLARAKGQLKRTTVPTVRSDDVGKVARDIIKRYGSKASSKDVAAQMEDLANLLVRGGDEKGDATFERIKESAAEIMSGIIYQSDSVYDPDEVELRKTIKDAIRSTPLYVSKYEKSDIALSGAYDSYNEFRKRNIGKLKTTNDPSALHVDVFYQEMCERFPWVFDPEITSQAEQLNELIRVADAPMNPTYNVAEEAEAEANELIFRLIEEVRQAQTYADRIAKREALAVAHELNKNAVLKEKLAAAREATKEKQREKNELRRQKNRVIEDIKVEQRLKAEQQRDATLRREAEERLYRLVKNLDKSKLSAVNREYFKEHFGDINTLSIDPTGQRLARIADLEAEYKALVENENDFLRSPSLEALFDQANKEKVIADMSDEELYNYIYCAIELQDLQREQNRMRRIADRTDVRMQAFNVIADVDFTSGRRDNAIGRLTDGMIRDVLGAVNLIRRYTGYNDGDPLYQRALELAAGERAADKYAVDAEAAFKPLLDNKKMTRVFSGKNAAEIEITARSVRAGDKPVKLKITPALRAALYMHLQNDDNMRHAAIGGIYIPDVEKLKAGKISEAYSEGTLVRFEKSELKRITAGMSDFEKQFAAKAGQYFGLTSAQALTDTYEALHGVPPKMIGKGYFPINVVGTATGGEVSAETLLASYESGNGDIMNPGWMKERAASKMPILLVPIDTVVNRAIQNHARYVGLAVPLQNFRKLWTASIWERSSRYNAMAKADETSRTPVVSVREAISEKWGPKAASAIDSVVSQISGAERRTNATVFGKMRSRYAGAVLELSLSTALKQTPSGIAAAYITGWGPLMKAATPGLKADTSFIDERTAAYTIRKKGYSSQELGELASTRGKLPPALSWIITADLATTSLLKRAAVFYVRDNFKTLSVGSEAFRQKVVEIYEQIISETQPTYDVSYRAAVLRSNNEVKRALHMFKTQPYKNFGIVYTALENLAAKRRAYFEANKYAADSDEGRAYIEEARKAYKDAKKGVSRAITSQIVSGLAISLIMSAWDMFIGNKKKYKDEDGDITFLSFLKGFGINFLSTGAGAIPFGGAVLETLEVITDQITNSNFFGTSFYGFDVPEIEMLNNFVKSGTNLVKVLTSGGADAEKLIREFWKVLNETAQFMGVPLKNITKLAKGVAQNLFRTKGKYVGEFYALRVMGTVDAYKQAHYDNLYKAYKNDKAQYQEIYNDLIDNGVTEKAIKDAMESRMKKEQGVGSVKELESRYLSPMQQKEYDKTVAAVKQSNVYYESDSSDRARLNELAYEVVTTDRWKSYSAVEDNNLNATEYVLYKLAIKLVDEPNSKGNYGTYTKEETEKAIEMAKGN